VCTFPRAVSGGNGRCGDGLRERAQHDNEGNGIPYAGSRRKINTRDLLSARAARKMNCVPRCPGILALSWPVYVYLRSGADRPFCTVVRLLVVEVFQCILLIRI